MAMSPEQHEEFEGAEARALLGDELSMPPSASVDPPPESTESSRELLLEPLPELPLEFGPELPALTRGAAWCLGVSFFVSCAALGIWWQPGLFASGASFYAAGIVFLLAAIAHLNGLSLLKRIDPWNGARQQLELSYICTIILIGVTMLAFVVYLLQLPADVLFGLLFGAWLTGAGASWSLLFGLRTCCKLR